LAKNGLPAAMPNPSVGAVVVHDGQIIGEGFTSAYGGAHAEVNAIAFAKANFPNLLADSTIYVSLEPCSHYGKTPPCANLIIDSGIKNVVIGTIDPFAKVAGAGIKKLMEAGCTVTMGVLEDECRESNRRFFTFHQKKRPYIILKWAETADGFIAPKERNAQKPVWITNEYSRQLVHKWRSEEQAIVVGGQTVLADNPSLTTRSWEGKSPLRVILDSKGTLPKDLAVYDTNAQSIFLETSKPQEVCNRLYDEGIQSVIIEGGAKTLQSFIDANLWDNARVFIGKTTFGEGVAAPVLSATAVLVGKRQIEDDLLISYKNKIS